MKIIRIAALSLALISIVSCASETKESTESKPVENVTIINEAPNDKPEKPTVEAEVKEEGTSISIETDENGKVSGSVDIDL